MNNYSVRKKGDTTPAMASKILLVGSPSSGKTSWLRRLETGLFDDNYTPTPGTQSLAVEDLGLELVDCTTPPSYDGATGVIVMIDITSQESLGRARELVEEADQKLDSQYPILLVVNKIDLLPESILGEEDASNAEYQHRFDEVVELSDEYETDFITISAKAPFNLQEPITYFLDDIVVN